MPIPDPSGSGAPLRPGNTQALLEAIIQNTPNVAIQGYDEGARVTFWNKASIDLYGFSPEQVLGRRLQDVGFWGPVEEREYGRMIAGILGSGRAAPLREWSINTRDGRKRHVMCTLFPVQFAGDPTRVICMDVDITERQQAEEALRASEERAREMAERQRELLRELDHRVKNNLASLHALVDLYAGTAKDVEAFAAAMRGKLQAMRAAHELTAAEGGRAVSLIDLIHRLIRLFDPPGRSGSAVSFDGPDLRIAPRQVGPVAMVFQELFVNAMKHGALGDPDGKVEITWHVTGPRPGGLGVTGTWRERSIRPVSAPTRRGVGLELIERFAQFELGGRAKFFFEPPGFGCEIESVLDPAE